MVDAHNSDRERREFLRDVLGWQAIQTTDYAKTYGNVTTNSFDGDVAIVGKVADTYRSPAVVTIKGAEEAVADRLHETGATSVDHYGDLVGSNRLGDEPVGVVLGCQHHGHTAVEQWVALNGEEANATGRGLALNYGSETANDYLRHMWHDHVMQVALRFGRHTDGATVALHTGAVSPDLPVVGRGEVVETYSETAQRVADAAAALPAGRFDAADVRERLAGRQVAWPICTATLLIPVQGRFNSPPTTTRTATPRTRRVCSRGERIESSL